MTFLLVFPIMFPIFSSQIVLSPFYLLSFTLTFLWMDLYAKNICTGSGGPSRRGAPVMVQMVQWLIRPWPEVIRTYDLCCRVLTTTTVIVPTTTITTPTTTTRKMFHWTYFIILYPSIYIASLNSHGPTAALLVRLHFNLVIVSEYFAVFS